MQIENVGNHAEVTVTQTEINDFCEGNFLGVLFKLGITQYKSKITKNPLSGDYYLRLIFKNIEEGKDFYNEFYKLSCKFDNK